jgi:hypothetical protein
MNYIILVCHKPNTVWIDFLKNFTQYKVYIIIDDETIDYSNYVLPYKNTNITFVLIKHTNCMIAGITNLNFTLNKIVTGWEKAICFVKQYLIDSLIGKIWFLEDDTFFYSEKTLLDIDSQYPNSDLLTAPYVEESIDDPWHWKVIPVYNIPKPYYRAMVCATRMSATMLKSIYKYANTYQTLFFIEALVPTLAKKNGLVYDSPKELSTIVYRQPNDIELDETHIFHPIKNIESHIELRKNIETL